MNGTKVFRRCFSRFHNGLMGSAADVLPQHQKRLAPSGSDKRRWRSTQQALSARKIRCLDRNRFAASLNVACESHLAELGSRQ